jgi:hypothetical protein
MQINFIVEIEILLNYFINTAQKYGINTKYSTTSKAVINTVCIAYTIFFCVSIRLRLGGSNNCY